jgi:hypothetical protein
MIGPFIPEHLLKSKQEGKSSEEHQPQEPEVDHAGSSNGEEDDIDAYAPELPPDMLQSKPAQQEVESTSRRRRAPIGPSLPTGPISSHDVEDDIIGPILPGRIEEVGSPAETVLTALILITLYSRKKT